MSTFIVARAYVVAVITDRAPCRKTTTGPRTHTPRDRDRDLRRVVARFGLRQPLFANPCSNKARVLTHIHVHTLARLVDPGYMLVGAPPAAQRRPREFGIGSTVEAVRVPFNLVSPNVV